MDFFGSYSYMKDESWMKAKTPGCSQDNYRPNAAFIDVTQIKTPELLPDKALKSHRRTSHNGHQGELCSLFGKTATEHPLETLGFHCSLQRPKRTNL